jgi:crotonobetainyl-CoA:carnitine CoA-transferase CaiB-like acyl-CoA transferase
MWMATRIGFFSVVEKDGQVHVRARARGDLAELCEFMGWSRAWMEQWPNADYRWRVRVNRALFQALCSRLPELVDYPNFKSEVARRPRQRAKLPAYSRLWQDLQELQWQEEGGRDAIA